MSGALTSPGFRRQKQNELQGMVRLVSDLIDLYSEYKMAMAERFPFVEWLGDFIGPRIKATIGFDESVFKEKLNAMMINFPLSQKELTEHAGSLQRSDDITGLEELSESIFYFIELCWASINDFYLKDIDGFTCIVPNEGGEKKQAFKIKINELFRRYTVPFSLNDEGRIEAILPDGLDDLIREAQSGSSEEEVDELVAQAMELIRKPKLEDKRIAVEKLWDAFERLKTCVGDYDGRNKLETVDKIIRETAENSAIFTEIMENEMRALTEVGNEKLMIRHCETGKMPISSVKHADYLFYRMLALVTLLRQSISAKA